MFWRDRALIAREHNLPLIVSAYDWAILDRLARYPPLWWGTPRLLGQHVYIDWSEV
jgi:hypothetical protein